METDNFTYRIKPLEWIETQENVFEARTPFGFFWARRRVDADRWNTKYLWGYCFSEHFDEDEGSAYSIYGAKEECEKIWSERMKKCLVSVEI